MIIKSLKLYNYRRFKQLDLEFPENLIGIIGRNGAGKSTIIEAIGWTLYGNRFVRTDKQDVRSQYVDGKDACQAEMIFSYGGSEYRIVRKLKGKNAISEASVYRNGQPEPEAVQDRGVNEFIENLLQLDYRSFTTSVFAQQKELAKLTTLQPEQRRQAINRLINIDRIDRARELVRRDRNEKQAFIDGKRSALRDIKELELRRKSLSEEKKQQSAQHAELQKGVQEIEAALAAVRAQFDAVSKLRDQYAHWDAQIGRLQSRLEENQKNALRAKAELRDIQEAEKELALLAEPLREFDTVKKEKQALDENREKQVKLRSRRNELQVVQDALKKEEDRRLHFQADAEALPALEKELAELEQREKALEQRRVKLREAVKEAHGLTITAESRGKEIKEKLENIESLGPEGECPVCTQRLADHYDDVLQTHQVQLAQLRQEYREHLQSEKQLVSEQKENDAALYALRKEKESVVKKLRSAQDAQKTVLQIDGHIAGFREQEKLIQRAIAGLGEIDYDEERHHRLKARVEELLQVQQKAARLEERVGRREGVEAELTATQKSIAELQGEIDDARSAQAALAFSESDYLRAKKEVDDKTSAATQARGALAAASQALAVLERDIDNVQKEIAEQKKMQRDIRQAEEEVVYLNALEEYFSAFRLELAGRIRPLIAHRASELLALTTMSRYSQFELDQDYNIHIYDGNVAHPIERFSGGEQDLANLCLRIAVSQVVAERSGGAPINFIVLDEIFGSQDTERRDLILNALGQLSSQFRQIFVITHIEAVKEVLPVLLHVEQKTEAVSSASFLS